MRSRFFADKDVIVKPLFKLKFEKGAWGMTRPSDITRERIVKAAQRLFADRGYEETSIRAIVAKAAERKVERYDFERAAF